jgi:hypothetical protein
VPEKRVQVISFVQRYYISKSFQNHRHLLVDILHIASGTFGGGGGGRLCARRQGFLVIGLFFACSKIILKYSCVKATSKMPHYFH